eukprot:6145895-Prymnesium_polylepis.1
MPSPAVWRLRAALRCAGAAVIATTRLGGYGDDSESTWTWERYVFGGAAALLGGGFAIGAVSGPPPLEACRAPPPPMRTAWFVPKLLYLFWWPAACGF